MTAAGFEQRLTAALEAILAAVLFAILALVIVLVVMRYAFQSGLVGANEAATMMFVYLSSIGASVAVGRQEHIRVDLFSQRLGARGRLAMEAASLVLVAALNAVILINSLTWIRVTGHVPMPVTQVPRAVLQASIPLGCGLAVLYCALKLRALLREDLGS